MLEINATQNDTLSKIRVFISHTFHWKRWLLLWLMFSASSIQAQLITQSSGHELVDEKTVFLSLWKQAFCGAPTQLLTAPNQRKKTAQHETCNGQSNNHFQKGETGLPVALALQC